MNRRDCVKALAGTVVGAAALPSGRAAAPTAAKGSPIVNGAEHAWVINDAKFPIDPRVSTCPKSMPRRSYSMEHLLEEMQVHGIDKTVISHVCYYGLDNSYTIHCVKSHPDRFAGIGLLV